MKFISLYFDLYVNEIRNAFIDLCIRKLLKNLNTYEEVLYHGRTKKYH